MSSVFDCIPPIVCPGCGKIVAQMTTPNGLRAAILCRRCKQRVIVIVDGERRMVELEGRVGAAT
ncbi:MAG: hypothetical protein IPG34_20035 [Rhodocyclaceae bacterium]|nr:hypothetical protein [Rhodocyclaceae bacterium]